MKYQTKIFHEMNYFDIHLDVENPGGWITVYRGFASAQEADQWLRSPEGQARHRRACAIFDMSKWERTHPGEPAPQDMLDEFDAAQAAVQAATAGAPTVAPEMAMGSMAPGYYD